jgi:replicative DNA helicase
MSAEAVENFLGEKELPSSIEAERSILGAILLDNAVCNQAIELLSREDFFFDSHRRIFDKMVALNERSTPIDLITLGDELRKATEFEQVGGATYIALLIDGVPRTDTIEHYARIVKEKALRRELIRLSQSLLNWSLDEEVDLGSTLDRVTRQQETIGNQYAALSGTADDRLIHGSLLDTIPPAVPLIENLINTRQISQIFAAPGLGKSFLALDIALSVAQFGNVVYIAAEVPEEYPPRVAAWCAQHNASVGGFHLWIEPVCLLDSRSVDSFVRVIKHLNPLLIVIDPLASCMVGGSDSDTGDMQAAVSELNRIVRRTGAAIKVIHHAGWNEAHERGSTILRGACRVVARVSNNDGLITLSCEKANSVAFETRHFRLVGKILEDGRLSAVLLPAQKVDMRGTKLTQRQREVLEALALALFKDGASFTDLQRHLSIANSTLNSSISRLMERGLVKKKGRLLLITASGLAETRSDQTGDETASQRNEQKTELGLNWSVNFNVARSDEFAQSSIDSSTISNLVQSEFSASAQSSVHSLSLGESGILNSNERR